MAKQTNTDLENIKFVWVNMKREIEGEMDTLSVQATTRELTSKELNRHDELRYRLIIINAGKYLIDPVGRWE